jgi:hypothetical protein
VLAADVFQRHQDATLVLVVPGKSALSARHAAVNALTAELARQAVVAELEALVTVIAFRGLHGEDGRFLHTDHFPHVDVFRCVYSSPVGFVQHDLHAPGGSWILGASVFFGDLRGWLVEAVNWTLWDFFRQNFIATFQDASSQLLRVFVSEGSSDVLEQSFIILQDFQRTLNSVGPEDTQGAVKKMKEDFV